MTAASTDKLNVSLSPSEYRLTMKTRLVVGLVSCFALGALALTGCSDDTNEPDATGAKTGAGGSDAGGAPADGPSPEGGTGARGGSVANSGAGEAGVAGEASSAVERRFVTSSVVFSDEGQTSYVSVLSSLTDGAPDPSQAQEFAGWADLWVNDGRVFIAEGESPEVGRYEVDAAQKLEAEGRVSFLNYGGDTAAFWAELFVSKSKAYWFNTAERQIVVWDPEALEITTSFDFDLPALDDQSGMTLAGPSADRSSVVRGTRAYVPFYWANWDSYAISEDSVVLVIDTESDEVLDVLDVPCPEINFASLDTDGTIYFSNWGYSAVPSVVDGKRSACAVRILDGSDALDPDWSLTFADATGGREASALRTLGDGTALITVLHDERLELTPEVDRYALTDSSNWRLWKVDMTTFQAEPIDTIGWHAPGLYGARLGEDSYLFVPSADYATTTTYRFSPDGNAKKLWESTGWQTRLFEISSQTIEARGARLPEVPHDNRTFR
jgi:hypothetical protein